MKKWKWGALAVLLCVLFCVPVTADAAETKNVSKVYTEKWLEVFGDENGEDGTYSQYEANKEAILATLTSEETEAAAIFADKKEQLDAYLAARFQGLFDLYGKDGGPALYDYNSGTVNQVFNLGETGQVLYIETGSKEWAEECMTDAENIEAYYDAVSGYYSYIRGENGWDKYWAAVAKIGAPGESLWLMVEYTGYFPGDPAYVSKDTAEGELVWIRTPEFIVVEEDEIAALADGQYYVTAAEEAECDAIVEQIASENFDQEADSAAEAKEMRARAFEAFMELSAKVHVKGENASTGFIGDTTKKVISLPGNSAAVYQVTQFGETGLAVVARPIQHTEELAADAKALVETKVQEKAATEELKDYNVEYNNVYLTDDANTVCTLAVAEGETAPILIPYPEGVTLENVDKYDFKAYHYNADTKALEALTIGRKTAFGVEVGATSCSPFVLAYKEAGTGQSGTGSQTGGSNSSGGSSSSGSSSSGGSSTVTVTAAATADTAVPMAWMAAAAVSVILGGCVLSFRKKAAK